MSVEICKLGPSSGKDYNELWVRCGEREGEKGEVTGEGILACITPLDHRFMFECLSFGGNM